MFKSIGILLYLLILLLHYLIGDNREAFWVMLYYFTQNTAMCLFCISTFSAKKMFVRIVSRIGFTYFSSAAIFYLYAFLTSQKIYFSDCGEAGVVLICLIVIAILLTLIDAWRDGK